MVRSFFNDQSFYIFIYEKRIKNYDYFSENFREIEEIHCAHNEKLKIIKKTFFN